MAEELGKSSKRLYLNCVLKDHYYFNILASKERERHVKIPWAYRGLCFV